MDYRRLAGKLGGARKMAESEKPIRVLYVCPWAHWAGHPPYTAIKESAALVKAGAQVSLCTFRGIRGQKEPQIIPHRTVVSSWIGSPLGVLTNLLLSLKINPMKGLAWFLEQFSTLFLAVKLRKTFKYDVIYLCDGDPFIFTPFLLGLVFRHYRWAVVLAGVKALMSPSSLSHKLFHKLINAPMWKPIYRSSLAKNQFTFVCPNKYVKDYFETNFLDGILSGRVSVIPLGVEQTASIAPQKEARRFLGLPEDKVIFLNFGSLHLGKDIETVLAAISDIPDVLLIHAGAVTVRMPLTTPQELLDLVQHYGVQNRVIIKDYYIPEEEKQYYFGAADATILSYKRDTLQTTSMLWEAAKFRSPTIASDVGELGELVKRYKVGLVFEAENATSLKRALSHFLSSSQSEKETMMSNYGKFGDEFSLDEWAQKHMKSFRELCEH